MTEQPYTNRLIHENSPYLLQHAHNPVDWYAWGEAAFEKAAREEKPVLLSIGYSTCHWCHVMEREVFADAEAAALINRVCVPIKVDREERPDLDQVYMKVSQMLTGSGGWPLNIFMTADRQPFYAATYIPKRSRFGHPGVMELLPRIEQAWNHNRSDMLGSATKITRALQSAVSSSIATGGDIEAGILDRAYNELSNRFDSEHGGFGEGQKFPMPHHLRFLLRYWQRSDEAQALAMVEQTLTAMRFGGIYDQIGFGFHRYATDRSWLLPHFEKMLYDQALIAIAYLEAHAATGKAFTPAAPARYSVMCGAICVRLRGCSMRPRMPTARAGRDCSTCGACSSWKRCWAKRMQPGSAIYAMSAPMAMIWMRPAGCRRDEISSTVARRLPLTWRGSRRCG